jgi:hypothetical protein
MKKKFFSLFLIFAVLFVVVGTFFFKGKPRITQAEMSRAGTTQIDAHGICMNVINSGSKELMVPYKTKGEWCSFLNASLKDVSITYCQRCYWICTCTNCGGSKLVCEDYNVGSCP